MAPPGGAVVTLYSDSLLAIPAPTVTVPSGATQANFEIRTPRQSPVSGSSGGNATISAAYRSQTRSAALFVSYLI